jgi:O-antigen/teichoic acid export membrane protein
LGPEAFGQYGAAAAFVGLFRILPDLGMSYASTLAISRDRSLASRLGGNLLGFQVVLSALTLALALGVGRVLFEGVTWTAVVVLSADLILKALQSTLRWLLRGFERFGAEAVTLLAERVTLLVLGLLVLRLGYGVVGFVLVFLVVRAVDTSGLYGFVHSRVAHLAPAFDRRLWWDLLLKGLPFAYAGAMITLFFQVDTVMLEHMRSDREVGWYVAPVRVLEGLSILPRIIGFALIPTMAALHARAPEKVTELYRRGSKYLLVAGLPIAAFGALAALPFMTFLFGDEYAPSAAAARLLIPAAAFMFLSNLGETTLACINRCGTIVVVSTAALVLNVALNLVWIPRAGAVGAAGVTLVTEGSYFAMTALALEAYGHRPGWLRLLLRPALATAAFAATLWASIGLGLFAASAIASTVFVLSTLALGVWDEREWALARELLRGRPSL